MFDIFDIFEEILEDYSTSQRYHPRPGLDIFDIFGPVNNDFTRVQHKPHPRSHPADGTYLDYMYFCGGGGL
jgi:hypothetical protein